MIEKLAGTSFEKHTKRMFQFWGLQNTHLDEHDPIVMNRARYMHCILFLVMLQFLDIPFIVPIDIIAGISIAN